MIICGSLIVRSLMPEPSWNTTSPIQQDECQLVQAIRHPLRHLSQLCARTKIAPPADNLVMPFGPLPPSVPPTAPPSPAATSTPAPVASSAQASAPVDQVVTSKSPAATLNPTDVRDLPVAAPASVLATVAVAEL